MNNTLKNELIYNLLLNIIINYQMDFSQIISDVKEHFLKYEKFEYDGDNVSFEITNVDIKQIDDCIIFIIEHYYSNSDGDTERRIMFKLLNMILPELFDNKIYGDYKIIINPKLTNYNRTYYFRNNNNEVDELKRIYNIELIGYIKYNNLIELPRCNNHLDIIPKELHEIIISNLNRSELILILHALPIFEDNLFETMIYRKSKEIHGVLSKFKIHLKLNWQQIYLLYYPIINGIYLPQNEDKKYFKFRQYYQSDNEVRRYCMYKDYPELYNELIKFESIDMNTSDHQFYLYNHKNGFNWFKISTSITHRYIYYTFKSIASKHNISMYKLLQLLEKYNMLDVNDFSRLFNNSCVESLSESKSYKRNVIIETMQFIYNKMGYTDLFHFFISDVELFKWFRGYSTSYENQNTYGPVKYSDLNMIEIYQKWVYEYACNSDIRFRKPSKLNKNKESIKFIITDYPEFNVNQFYIDAKLKLEEMIKQREGIPNWDDLIQ